MEKAVIFIADGSEELEAIGVIDVLRRSGVDVTISSVMGHKQVKCSHETQISADSLAEETNFSDVDMLILPGGMPGTTNIGANDTVCKNIREFAAAGKWVCAICAAPTVLGSCGVLEGKNATCFPGCEEGLAGANYTAKNVEVDGNIITANGPGSAIDFALKLVEVLLGANKSNEIASGMQYR